MSRPYLFRQGKSPNWNVKLRRADGTTQSRSTKTSDHKRSVAMAVAWNNNTIPFGEIPPDDWPLGPLPQSEVVSSSLPAASIEVPRPEPTVEETSYSHTVEVVDESPDAPRTMPSSLRDINKPAETRNAVAAALGVKAPELKRKRKNETLCNLLGGLSGALTIGLIGWSIRMAGREPGKPDEAQLKEYSAAWTEQLREWFVDVELKPWHTIVLVGFAIAFGMWMQGRKIPAAQPKTIAA